MLIMEVEGSTVTKMSRRETIGRCCGGWGTKYFPLQGAWVKVRRAGWVVDDFKREGGRVLEEDLV